MELIDFLAARIAEEERAAQEQVKLRKKRYPWSKFTPDGGEVGYWVDRGPWLQAEPEHVLAQCVARRAVIEVVRPGSDTATVFGELEAAGTFPPELLAALAPIAQSFEDGLEDALAVILKCLALPYHSHPDYQQEWKRA